MSMIYYVCSYEDYTNLPDKLFCENTPSRERKSIDGLKFIVRCEDHKAGEGCFSWMLGSEVELTQGELLEELVKQDWAIADEGLE